MTTEKEALEDLTFEFSPVDSQFFRNEPAANLQNDINQNSKNNQSFSCEPSFILDESLNESVVNLPEDSHGSQSSINKILNEGIAWNEQTWLPSSQSSQPPRQHSTSLFNPEESFTLSQPDLLSELNSPLGFQKNNENDTFYGLPLSVKSLLQRVKNVSELYDWQEECLNLNAIKIRKNLIYALPTSGGKTLVAEILMLKEIVCHQKNVLFILPYVAIVQEKIQSLAPFAMDLQFLLEEYAGGRGQYPPIKRRRKNTIYVCTIEKAAGLLNSLIELERLHEIGLVVVDELHLLGENGGRGATLEGILTKLMYINEPIHIIGMSATIGNLQEVANFLNADLYTGNFRPVELKEYVKSGDDIWLVDLKEEEIFTDRKVVNYRYSESALQQDPDRIGGLVMDVVPNDSCLIFCSSRKNCENVALLLTRVLFRSLLDHRAEAKAKLLSDLTAEDSLCPILSKTIIFGVAYHHSGLTAEERRLLEDAFRDGTLSVICCTSTLAAGVNLPARRVILRTPYMGRDFLNLSAYKQMTGRAGRAGLGAIGESILLCKPFELVKVRQLLTSKMEDCTSSLIANEDRGINNLILTSVMLSIATTRSSLHKLVSRSLLGTQSIRLDVKIKRVTDAAITKLIKSQILKIKNKPRFNANMTIAFQSQAPKVEENKRTITLTQTSEVELSDLGKAAMKGCIDLHTAFDLYQDLKVAQRQLVLINDLHMLYLITPYDMANQLTPVGSVYFDVMNDLSSSMMAVAKVIGINEMVMMKLRDGIIPKNIERRVVHRFYLTLILYELWQQQSLYVIAQKYQVNRGVIQNLLNSASSFAMAAVRFCKELPEFWMFTELFTAFGRKLDNCCSVELEPLMNLPFVKIGRARQLYNAGYKSLQLIASAQPEDLQEKLKHMSKKMAERIISAAHVLIMTKLENLKDEVADMMEGLETSMIAYQ